MSETWRNGVDLHQICETAISMKSQTTTHDDGVLSPVSQTKHGHNLDHIWGLVGHLRHRVLVD